MHPSLTGLCVILVAAQRHSDTFLAEDSSGGLGSPIDRTYTLHSTSGGEPDIESFRFTRQQGGRVFITAYKGRLPKGQYDCGYELAQSSGASRYTLTLKDPCRQVVMDSTGYYDYTFLTGCFIDSDYQYLHVRTATTGYDIYRSNTIPTTTPTPTTTTPCPTRPTTPCPTVTTTTSGGDCKAGDAMCNSYRKGSYCKYWLNPKVCSATNKPCCC
ncbi:hypothetical protein FOZ61_003236 [Perkinsus olseni]|uniref:Uncharacterized protein n=1 Tax=Perkinsus olseni TaxID=32597 RepID=A0A7J6MI55_PEROL|nr:hypothetical protein FOZ61_003236 [Perkinsus olseni]KAF4675649.1 hypothetical protein FOL46_000841 [Perkinsus olseni]